MKSMPYNTCEASFKSQWSPSINVQCSKFSSAHSESQMKITKLKPAYIQVIHLNNNGLTSITFSQQQKKKKERRDFPHNINVVWAVCWYSHFEMDPAAHIHIRFLHFHIQNEYEFSYRNQNQHKTTHLLK